MPWDGTELRVAELGADGVAADVRTLLGSTTESVLQPEWADDDSLFALTDRDAEDGFWNVHRVAVDGGDPVPVHPMRAEFGGPLWQLGMRWYSLLDDGRLLTVRTYGTDTLGVLDPRHGAADRPRAARPHVVRARRSPRARGAAVDGRRPGRHRPAPPHLDTARAHRRPLDADDLPDRAVPPGRHADDLPRRAGPRRARRRLPAAQPRLHRAGRRAAALRRLRARRPDGRPAPRWPSIIAYFTSRGIGVVDVNYGGSTGLRPRVPRPAARAVGRGRRRGHGDRGAGPGRRRPRRPRPARDRGRLGRRLDGAGRADEHGRLRLRRRRSSASPSSSPSRRRRTTSSRATSTGSSGRCPRPGSSTTTRAPLNNVAGLSCPVLLLQGLDDPIVPPSQAEQFRDALVAKGIPHAYRAYAGESHGFRKRETIIDCARVGAVVLRPDHGLRDTRHPGAVPRTSLTVSERP